ncbi:response regulator transcription factor [Enterococcus saccharolyticus]|uniref:DNA-binding response regulator n=1 Tax=Candidatus Enterococcus willemsii TaxID=1857215 RepID=A0ABQ6YWS9_9ENTE|nr:MULTISPECIES: response regulator transcription factor [Enterococcus]KAF1302156.1 DNA-binding response regulator [Enterococcus sp. CU12B]MCD5001863.1 response regulator transcription factor [Enterococcus saccharolyticus]
MIQVIVVDDDRLVTESLRTILEIGAEIEVLAVGHSADEAVELFTRFQPDVLLMDIRMGNQTGIDAAKAIFTKYPQAAILLLTTFSDEEYIREALQIGVKGYLIKQNLADIIPAIKAVAKGQSVFGNEVADKLSTILTTAPKKIPIKLTNRETEILEQIAEGKNNKEIAEALFLSEGTVRNYISQLLDKLDVRDRTQLAIYYYKNSE